MTKKLVLVESPAKAKTINKYLGKNYYVEATVGHIRNLPKSKLGVDLLSNFEPQFVTIRGKGDTIKKIKSLASKSKEIFIATDPDREGEAIAQDIAEVLNNGMQAKIHRVLFNEITKNGVKKAMESPRSINTNLVSSQRARRVMDRIIGYKISPFLWKAVIESAGDATLSAGRVQSVALRIICEREEEINKFIATEYWSIWAEFETYRKETFHAKLTSVSGKELKIQPKPVMTEDDWKLFLAKNFAINNEKDAIELFEKISKEKDYFISDITKKGSKRNAPPPFITSSLQAEASRRLRYRPKMTMMFAQRLYEGIDLGKEGTVGLITYMRTDSTRVSPEITNDARNFIKEKFGENFLPENPNFYDKKKNALQQDAHEAIRPTSIEYTPEFVKPYLEPKEFKLYELIWKRFIASQMNPALLENTTVEVTSGIYIFKAFGTAILFKGYMQLYDEAKETNGDAEEKDEGENDNFPSGLKKDDKLILQELKKTQHFTRPPARFTESSLIKELESKGIGRPSTFSLVVSTIQDRKYVSQQDRKLFPTQLGIIVNGILVKNFPEIINVNFTAKMETELDQIAQGENDYPTVLNDFYIPFSSALKKVESNIEKIECDKCGNELLIKVGRFGKYLACSNYPECNNIKSLREYSNQVKEVEFTGDDCPKCNSKTVYRIGKFGKFIGCERYPDCDYIKNISLGVNCPKCKEGDIVERRSKRNRVFYGCSRYPDCDHVSWYKPIPQSCTKCNHYYIESRYTAKKGNYLKCPDCGEEYSLPENES